MEEHALSPLPLSFGANVIPITYLFSSPLPPFERENRVARCGGSPPLFSPSNRRGREGANWPIFYFSFLPLPPSAGLKREFATPSRRSSPPFFQAFLKHQYTRINPPSFFFSKKKIRSLLWHQVYYRQSCSSTHPPLFPPAGIKMTVPGASPYFVQEQKIIFRSFPPQVVMVNHVRILLFFPFFLLN